MGVRYSFRLGECFRRSAFREGRRLGNVLGLEIYRNCTVVDVFGARDFSTERME